MHVSITGQQVITTTALHCALLLTREYSQYIIESICQSISQSINQSVSVPVSQSVSQSVSKSVHSPLSYIISFVRTVHTSVHRSVNQSISKSVNQNPDDRKIEYEGKNIFLPGKQTGNIYLIHISKPSISSILCVLHQ